MEASFSINDFMDQPNQVDNKFYEDVILKNLKLYEKVEKLINKRLENELKLEKDIEKKEGDIKKLREKRQKENDSLEEEVYKEKIERLKKEKTNFEKLKTFDISELIPKNLKNSTNFEKPSLFEDLFKSIKSLPDMLFKKINNESKTGEQKNIGEEVLRVSFHPEGVVILKKLLDPIYKALNANTDALDKMLKAMTQKDNGGGGGILLLLAAAASMLARIFGRFLGILDDLRIKILRFIDDLKNFPSRIKEALKLDELFDFLKLKFLKIVDSIKDVGSYMKSYWDEFITTPFKEKWNIFIKEAKNTIKFDELVEAYKIKQAGFLGRLKEILKFDDVYNSVKTFGTKFDDIWNTFVKNPFNKGIDVLSDFGKVITEVYNAKITPMFESLKSFLIFLKDELKLLWEGFKNLKTPLIQFGEGIKTLLGYIPGLSKIISVFKGLSVVLVVLDPIVAAFKTLFEVWNDDSLSVLQKGVGVLTSLIFGLGDGIATLTGILSSGVTGIWNLITGKGWDTRNSVSTFMKGLTDDYSFGGMGHKMGMTAIEMGKPGGVAFDKIKSALGMDVGAEALRTPFQKKAAELSKDGLTDEERKFLEEKFDQKGQPIDDFYKQPGSSTFIMDKKTGNAYRSAPQDEVILAKKGGVLDESLTKLKNIMSEVNIGIKNLNDNVSNNLKPTTITNTTISNGGTSQKENKNYLFKPLYDVNTDKRVQWWKHSREYSATA
jgi:hypothetical protein